MLEMEKNPEVPTSTRDEATFIPVAMCEASRGAPHNAKGDLTSLRRHERVPQVTTQLEKNHEIPPSSRDEALLFLKSLESNPESPLKTPQDA